MMESRQFKIFSMLLACAMTAGLVSCQKDAAKFRTGEDIRFAVGSGSAETKAAYSGVSSGNIERIDWEEGDMLRIYCDAVSEPASKYADYVVTEVLDPEGAISYAHIGGTGGVGLRWGTGDHTFYAVYPSPEDGGVTTSLSIGPYADGGTKASVSKSISGATVTAKLPASQKAAGVSGSGNYVAAPDLKNMLMTAKSKTYTEDPGITDEVFLEFTPLTTAVKFTITNQTKADLTLTSVSLTSASSALNGPFTVDIDDTGVPAAVDLDGDGSTTGTNDITYSRSYPKCTYTGSVTDATRTVKINFASPITLAYNADPAQSGKLTFTFFLQPCQNFNDITFKLVKSDNSWMSTRLGYTDGTGIIFPRFKKSEVTGVFVPEGAQWTVKYGPTVERWNNSGETPISPMPEVGEGTTLVTSWDSGVEDELELNLELNPPCFSVSPTKKVYFSKGNLYWDGSVFKFETNQLDYQTEWDPSHVNLFYYSKDVSVAYDETYNDPEASTSDVFFTNANSNPSTPNPEFTVNGETGTWMTLSPEEWGYLFSYKVKSGLDCSNETRDGLNAIYVLVDGVKCAVLYPDGYDKSKVVENNDETSYDTAEKRAAAEAEGIVFLPAAGIRNGSVLSKQNKQPYYWTSSPVSSDTQMAYCATFVDGFRPNNDEERNKGYSVRLVMEVK